MIRDKCSSHLLIVSSNCTQQKKLVRLNIKVLMWGLFQTSFLFSLVSSEREILTSKMMDRGFVDEVLIS